MILYCNVWSGGYKLISPLFSVGDINLILCSQAMENRDLTIHGITFLPLSLTCLFSMTQSVLRKWLIFHILLLPIYPARDGLRRMWGSDSMGEGSTHALSLAWNTCFHVSAFAWWLLISPKRPTMWRALTGKTGKVHGVHRAEVYCLLLAQSHCRFL